MKLFLDNKVTQFNNILIYGEALSGKSVFMKTYLRELMSRYEPKDCKLVVYDGQSVDYLEVDFKDYLLIPGCLTLDDDAFKTQLDRVYTLARLRTSQKVTSPHIVVVLDKVAKFLEKVDGAKEKIEEIMKLGPAVGIHMILSTQNPDIFSSKMNDLADVDVIFKTSLEILKGFLKEDVAIQASAFLVNHPYALLVKKNK